MILLSAGRTTAGWVLDEFASVPKSVFAGKGAYGSDVSELTFVSPAVLPFVFEFALSGDGVAEGVGVGVKVGVAFPFAAVIVTGDASLTVFGGRQSESLQT